MGRGCEPAEECRLPTTVMDYFPVELIPSHSLCIMSASPNMVMTTPWLTSQHVPHITHPSVHSRLSGLSPSPFVPCEPLFMHASRSLTHATHTTSCCCFFSGEEGGQDRESYLLACVSTTFHIGCMQAKMGNYSLASATVRGREPWSIMCAECHSPG